MRPFKIRIMNTGEILTLTSIQDIPAHVPIMLVRELDYLNPSSLDAMIAAFLKKMYRGIDAAANDESLRIKTMEQAQGKEATKEFVKRTYAVYRAHVVAQKRRVRHYYARKSFIESIMYFRYYLTQA